MSVIFDIEHTTHYRYARPVSFGEHTVLFRPRSSHDIRVLASDMVVTPQPDYIRLIHDVYSNSVALVQPQSPSDELKVVSTFTVEHTGTRALDLPLNHRAQTYPVDYSIEERFALAHYLQPFYTDPTGRLQQWGRQFIRTDGPTDSRDLLVVMNQHIKDQMIYQVRYEEGVQTPYQTLDYGCGTCRDFATLMIEAARWLGYAARFVTGYIHTPWLDTGETRYLGAGATHAWLQVYLPGAGWIPFDPTNNLIGGTSLIRVGVARHASLASPLKGSWHGIANDFLGMAVDVQVHQR